MNEMEKLALKRKVFTLELQKLDIEEKLIELKVELKTEKPVPHVVTSNIQPVKPIEKVTISADHDQAIDGEIVRKKISLYHKKIMRGSMELDPCVIKAGDRIKIFDNDFNTYVILRGSSDLEAIGSPFTVYGRQYMYVRNIAKKDGEDDE